MDNPPLEIKPSNIIPVDFPKAIDPEVEMDRLFNELNVMRIEGFYFCLDPKDSNKRNEQIFKEVIKHADGIREFELTIMPHSAFGWPSVLAYKIFQAVMKKLSEHPYPFPSGVYFSQRELAKLTGIKSFGGRYKGEFERAVDQLRLTNVVCHFYNKKTDGFEKLKLTFFGESYLSGKKDNITQCYLCPNQHIINSLNSGHFACFNYARMENLPPIAQALFKRLFHIFSILFDRAPNKKEYLKSFVFTKDYGDICKTWLGGLQVYKYKSKIEEQLGKHFKALQNCGFVRQIEVAKNAKSDGFNISFYPGRGFFEDYRKSYDQNLQLELPFLQLEQTSRVQPMELVAYFHKKRLHTEELDAVLDQKEVDFVAELLEQGSAEEVRALIDFALAEAEKTKFPIKKIQGLKNFQNDFAAKKAGIKAQQKQRKQIKQAEQNRPVIERLIKEHNEHFAEQINQALQALTAEERQKYTVDFEAEGLSKVGNFFKSKYREKGLEDPTLKGLFENFVAEKLLPPEDRDLVAYAKTKGYNLVKQDNGDYALATPAGE